MPDQSDPGSSRGAASFEFGDAAALVSARLEMAEMHHRFANVLQSVQALLALRSRGTGNEGCRQALAEAASQVHAFALLHERLRSGPGSERDAASPCCAAYLADVCRDLDAACLAPRGLRLDFSACRPLPLPESVCRSLGLLVTELVVNASKHAFRGLRTGVVAVSLLSSPEGTVRLTISDDGVGMTDVLADRHGEGIGFVAMLARSVGASCMVSTGSAGTGYAFEFPSGELFAGSGEEALASA